MLTLSTLALAPFVVLSTFAAPLPSPVPRTESLSRVSDVTEWHAQAGDHIVVDTQENEGILIHRNGQFLTFPVATGRRSTVCYIGRCYNAATPERTWQIAARDIKGDRMTFGPSGRFLRLFYKDESTPYGFHEYGNEKSMFDSQPRFKSMGCVIVKKQIMDILDQTFAVNEGNIPVITKFGIGEPAKLALAEQE